MIPILYPHYEKNFQNNGIGRLNCVSCIVTEERNGIYECEFTISVDDPIFPKIKEGQIIACIHDDRKDIQPFDIYGRSEPINGAVTFFAHHISYRLTKIMLEPYSASTCAQAMALIPSRSVNNNPFTFWTDKQTEGNFVLKVPQSVKATLGGVEGSILDTFGSAEYEFDKFTVKLYQHRGTDTGVDIRYGKNLLNFVHDKDESGTYNAVFPYWYNEEDDALVVLNDRLVVSADVAGDIMLLTEDGKQLVTEDGKQLIAEVADEDVNAVPLDLTTYFETAPTEEQLREKATAILSGAEAREGTENFTVDFQALWQTDEYKDVAPLQRLSLCDYANITHGKLGISKLKQQIIRVEYDVLRERYQRMELGKARVSFVDTVRAEVVNRTKDVPNMTTLQAALDNATALIKGGLGGYKVEITDADGHPMETLYMDSPNIETAMNILRINRNGIAFSRNGYNPAAFVSAWTIDGHFAANFIDTGVLTANIIRAGILTDLLGNNYWNLDTGEFRLTGYPTDSQMASAISVAETSAKNYSDNALNNYQETVNAIVADLQDQIDGQIESWYYDYEPTMNNAPASSWTTEDDRKAHEGDVFYWQSQGYSYRFVKSNGSWGWSLIQDSDISMAIATANNALALAGNKRRVFTAQPAPPYDTGDLWVQGANGDIKVCTTARSAGNYTAGDWANASKYTDDSALTTFLNGTYADQIASIQSQVDVKIETFYQAANPASSWASADYSKHTGDLWYKTSDNTTWRWSGSAWVEQEAPQSVFDAIDGKVNIFYGTPSGSYTGVKSGDYLVDSTDGSTYRYNGSAWVKVTDYTSALEDYQDTVDAIVAGLQDQIDGKIESWYYDYEPTLNNLPASGWSAAEKEAHEGDLFYWESKGYTYRFANNDGTWEWSQIQDSDILEAISDASDAMGVAGSKRRIFVTQPVPPYDVGDLWAQGSSGDIRVCTTAKESGSYVAGDWVKASKYTDDTAITTFLSGTYATDIQNIQSQIDGKIETFYQAADPSTGWASADKAKHTGDLWYKTSDNSTWRYSGSAWVEQEAPQAVFDAIDGKVNIFYGTPSGTYADAKNGDYLVDSTDGSTYRRNGTSWTKVTDYSSAISTAVTNYDASQDQLAIYNKLTNNGQTQGIYLQNGRLYINAEYLTSGTIADSTGKTYWDLDTGEFIGTFAMQDKYVYNYHGTLIASKTGRSDIGIKIGYYVNPYGTYNMIDGAMRPYNKETILGAIQSCFDNKANKYLFYRSLYMGDASANPNGEAIDTTITEKQAARSVVLTTDSLTEDMITGDGLLENYVMIRETFRQTVNSGYNVEIINDVVGYGDFDGINYLEQKSNEGYYNKVGHALISLLTTGNYKGIEIESNGTYFRLTPTTCVIYAASGIRFRYYNSYWRIEGAGRSGEIAVGSTSSERYKHDIKPLENEELDPHRLYDLVVKQFQYNDDADVQYWDMRGLTMAGFIAEDVAEIYPSATIRDYETKQIESWDERRIIPPMLSLIQEQKKEIDELRSEVDELKKIVNQILKEREE